MMVSKGESGIMGRVGLRVSREGSSQPDKKAMEEARSID